MMQIKSIYDIQRLKQSRADATKLKGYSQEDTSFQNILQNHISNKPESGNIDNNKKKTEDKRLMDVCVQMESIFVARMLKEMRNTIHKSELINGGFAEEIFEDMLYDEYALVLSKNTNLGLAKMLYEELSKK